MEVSPIEIVTGDRAKVGEFAAHLQGNNVVFHTAPFFRDGYKGGRHWKERYDAKVRGTAELFAQAYGAGVRRIVHTSSVAVLAGERGQLIDQSMRRRTRDADDYSLSKILSDREIDDFLKAHREHVRMHGASKDGWWGRAMPGLPRRDR